MDKKKGRIFSDDGCRKNIESDLEVMAVCNGTVIAFSSGDEICAVTAEMYLSKERISLLF